MKIRLLSIFFFLLAVKVLAQKDKIGSVNNDSLRSKFVEDSLKIYQDKPITPYIAIDFRNAYTNDRFLSFIGPQAGLTFNKRHTFALGFYFLNKISIFQSDKFRNYSFERINYLTLIYLYKLIDSRRFDLIFPFEAGYGNYRAEDESQESGNFVESNIIPVSLGMRFDILPHKWIGFKLGLGYRYIYEVNSKVDLKGLYFSIGIKLDLVHIYQDYSYFHLKRSYQRALKHKKE